MINLNRLRGLRVEKGLTQSDVAKYLGIAKTSYHRKETGVSELSLNEAHKLSLLFQNTIDEIFFTNRVTKCITKHKTA